LADPGEGQSGHGPHRCFREGTTPFPRLQKELLEVEKGRGEGRKGREGRDVAP